MKVAAAALILASLLPARTPSVKLPPFTRQVLPNGTVLLLMPKSDAPLVSLRAVVRGGAESDPPDLAGLSSVVASLLTRGTTTLTAEEFATRLDALGTHLQSDVTAESTILEMDCLPMHASAAIDLLASAILRPKFEEIEVHSQLSRSVEAARSRKDSPDDVVWQYFRSFFFPTGHPYSRPFQGDQLTLERIGRSAITAQYSRMYAGRNLAVAAVGPIDEAGISEHLAQAFGGLAAGRRYEWREERPLPTSKSVRLLLVDRPDATQTQFVIGLPGASRTSPDRMPLWLVNNVLGGRFTSLLNKRLRVESGLTYGAYSYVQQDRLPGAITLHSFAATANTKRALDLALGVLHRFIKEGVSAEQLDAARTYIQAAYPPENLQTSAQLAGILADLELYGLGRDEIDDLFARLDAVTPERANLVLKRYYAGSAPVLVLLGQAKQIRSQVRAYSRRITEASITDPGFASLP